MTTLRQTAEERTATELEILAQTDTDAKPQGWKLSPQAVLTYILGNTKIKGIQITPKYIGSRRLVEIAIATLLTDRALLLVGEPGTAKSWLSEHLAAAISGDSTKVVQGTAGSTEEQIRYSWNYAMLIANGPSMEAIVKSPVYRAMETGTCARIEEISRCVSEVQDALISILSEKRLSIPELAQEIPAQKGFCLIATANTRDKGINEMSAALQRRFNRVTLPTPPDFETEMEIVKTRLWQQSKSLSLSAWPPEDKIIEQVVTVYRELRDGCTMDNRQKVKCPSSTLSTADEISLLTNAMALSASFGNGKITPEDLASALHGAIIKDETRDLMPYQEYLENVMRKRSDEWTKLYNACRELIS